MERRLLAGHAWIYKNEVERSPTHAEAGDLVDVLDARGQFLGRGYLNPRSTILIRLLDRSPVPIDRSFFIERFRRARSWRQRMFQARPPDARSNPYRLVHGEADGLPGLIVDRYGDAVCLQILTAGTERHRDSILAALDEVIQPTSIVVRNDSPMREREGLNRERLVLRGAPQTPVQMNGLKVGVDLLEGQKTGLFLDQSDNYRLLQGLVTGAEVLDCFCYLGLWGLHAAQYGASQVIGVDQASLAIAHAVELANENGYGDRCQFQTRNVFDDLNERDRRQETFDLVILDPPAFVKNRGRLTEAIRGYKEINLRAMRLLREGGFLVTCSCSHHLSAESFRELLLDAAGDVGRAIKLVSRTGQSADHPILLGMPETEYLKCFVLQIM